MAQELKEPPWQIGEYLRWAERDLQRLEDLLTRIREATTLTDALQHQVFNSMVSKRTVQYDPPHLGLRLYIVRTILKHHGGTVRVRNLQGEQKGVAFTLTLSTAVQIVDLFD